MIPNSEGKFLAEQTMIILISPIKLIKISGQITLLRILSQADHLKKILRICNIRDISIYLQFWFQKGLK